MSSQTATNRLKVGEAVRKLRNVRGWTQQQLADACGVTVGYIAQIEGNRRYPSRPSLASICDALRFPVSFVYCLSDRSGDETAERCRELVELSLSSSAKERAAKR